MPLDLPVAIVGTGLIGRAWALAFARAGCDVRLWDPPRVPSRPASPPPAG